MKFNFVRYSKFVIILAVIALVLKVNKAKVRVICTKKMEKLRWIPRRCYCYYSLYQNSYQEHAKTLTHVDGSGKANMVEVGDKESTERRALAKASVDVGPQVFGLIKANDLAKGDVLTVAKLAGIMGAKKTAELIPLCHPLALTKVDVQCQLDEYESKIHILCEAQCRGRTGVEMEALTGASVAALTVYDMCKAVNKGIVITDIHLVRKSGGKSGDYVKNG